MIAINQTKRGWLTPTRVITAIIFSIFATIGYLYTPTYEMDLYRYYENADSLDQNISLIDYAIETANIHFDFIYFTTFLALKKMGAPKELATALFAGLLYSQAFLLIKSLTIDTRTQKSYRLLGISAFIAFSTAAPLYTLSISRNAAAFSFVFLSLTLLSKQRILPNALISIAAIYTHVLSFFYIIAALALQKISFLRINKRILRNTLLFLFVTISGTKFHSDLTKLDALRDLWFFRDFARYAVYLDPSANNAVGSIFDKLAYYDTLLILASSATMLLGLLRLKTYKTTTWVCYYMYIFYVLSFQISVAATQRTSIFLMPLHGFIVYEVLSQEKQGGFFLTAYKSLLITTLLAFTVNIIGNRYFLFG